MAVEHRREMGFEQTQFQFFLDEYQAEQGNIVRVGRTFGFDRNRAGEPYWPLLTQQHKRLAVLSSRGDYGYAPGERIAGQNHVEPSVRTAFSYIGITEMWSVAVEYDEFADGRWVESMARAEHDVDALVRELSAGTRLSPAPRTHVTMAVPRP